MAVAVPVALLPAIPLERVFNVSLLSDTFGLIPLMRVSTLVDGGVDAVRALIAVGAVAAALLFVLVPRRFAALTIVAVAAFLSMSPWSVAGTLRDQANATRAETHTGNPDWIDERVGPVQRSRSSSRPTSSRIRTCSGRPSSGTGPSATSTG